MCQHLCQPYQSILRYNILINVEIDKFFSSLYRRSKWNLRKQLCWYFNKKRVRRLCVGDFSSLVLYTPLCIMMRIMRLGNYLGVCTVRWCISNLVDQELPFARPVTRDWTYQWATAHTSFTRVKIVLDTKLVFAFSFKAYFSCWAWHYFVFSQAAALTATLPSPLAITPPPTTPPADRKVSCLTLSLSGDVGFIEWQPLCWFCFFVLQELITQKFEPTVKNSEKNSGIEISNDSLENDSNTPRANSERSAVIPEVKVENVEAPASSPRLTKRAAKPLRPGKKLTENNSVLRTFSCHKVNVRLLF